MGVAKPSQRLLLPYRPGLLYWWHFLFIIPWIVFHIGKNSIFKVGSGGSNKHTSLSLKVSTKLIAGPKDLGIIVERIDPSVLGSTLGVDSYTVYSTNTFEDNIHTEILVPVVVFNGRLDVVAMLTEPENLFRCGFRFSLCTQSADR